MKILLVQPPTPPKAIAGDEWFIFEPLALEYVAAGVTRDHEVRILDLRFGESLSDVLNAFGPDVVGVTAYTVHVKTAKRLLKTVKQWNQGTVTVVGGHHATIKPEDFVSRSVDLVVMGEGTFPFREIIERLERGSPLDGIPGVVTRDGASYPDPREAAALDLDALPHPARHLTAQYRSRYYCDWMKPLASIRTSMGCPYRCRFCALWKIAHGRYLKRAPEKVVEELAGIDEDYVFFADDESLLDARRMQRLADLIREAGIQKRYFLYGRSDTIARNPRLLKAWKEIGLTRVFVGLEFFRDEDLEYVGKGSTQRDNERAVQILRNLDIGVYGSFILRPEFEKRDFRELRRYCRTLGVEYPTFSVLTPLPGTDLYEDVKQDLITDDSDYIDFIHTLLPTRLPLKDFYRQYKWLLRTVLGPRRTISLLRKYPVRQAGSMVAKSFRIQKKVRNAWKDYDGGRVAAIGGGR